MADDTPRPLPVLHGDIWQVIFSYLSNHAILHVLSLVCKRWRSIALQSITVLTMPGIRSRALASFPRLSSLLIHKTPAAVVPPLPSLESLYISDIYPCGAEAILFQHLTVLTSVRSLSILSRSVETFLPLIHQQRTMVTALKFESVGPLPELTEMTFPRLTSLSLGKLYLTYYEADWLAVLSAHREQLTSFSVGGDYSMNTNNWRLLFAMLFPNMRSLVFEHTAVNLADATDFVNFQPKLQFLSLATTPEQLGKLNDIACAALRGVTFIKAPDADNIRAALSPLWRFPNLTRLSLRPRNHWDSEALEVVAESNAHKLIQHLTFRSSLYKSTRVYSSLLKFTGLTSLSLHGNNLVPSSLRFVHLPHLRSLFLDMDTYAETHDNVLRHAGRFIDVCPNLDEISINFSAPPAYDAEIGKSIRRFLMLANSKGISTVQLAKEFLSEDDIQFALSLGWTTVPSITGRMMARSALNR